MNNSKSEIDDLYNSSESTIKGTPLYMAPEIWGNQEYSKASDVYAFGIVVYEIITGTITFEGLKQGRIFLKVASGERPKIKKSTPAVFKEFIESCWKQNPSDRPTFDVIVEELMSDKYVIEEFGMKTNIDELREYQRRIDSSEFMKILESNAKLQRQQIEFEAKLQNQQIEFEKRMSQMKLMFEQTKLMYEQIELNKKQPLTTSDTENNENKKE